MNETKPYLMRMPKEMWAFFKKESYETGHSMNSLIVKRIERGLRKKKKKVDKK